MSKLAALQAQFSDVDLANQMEGQRDYPPMIAGRVAHIDADFLAYMCSYEREGEEISFQDMCHNTDIMIDDLRQSAAAETVVLHLTPSISDKGGRFDTAMIKAYQSGRTDQDRKPRFLSKLREWMHNEREAKMWLYCEADDGMSSAQYNTEDKNLSIIVTKDKDLSMVEGWHMEWDTRDLNWHNAFGKIWIEKRKTTSKLKGQGTKFFWAQLLMGDPADSISGLPLVVTPFLNIYKPTKKTEALRAKMENAQTDKIYRHLSDKWLDRKPMACGPMMAYNILNECQSDLECFKRVRELYEALSHIKPFRNYRNEEVITWQKALLSECNLLWMRLQDPTDMNDFTQWLRGVRQTA